METIKRGPHEQKGGEGVRLLDQILLLRIGSSAIASRILTGG